MNIVITSGGTSEDIDKVRKITNRSSGRLGSMIANQFFEKYQNNLENIYYLCNKSAILPNLNKKLQVVNITNVQSLQDAITQILTTKHIDIFVHSMAVSDYTVDYVTNTKQLSNLLANMNEKNIYEYMNTNSHFDKFDKISSDMHDLLIKLKPTPKIISMIKKLSPKTKLVGFKLLANSDYETLICAAKNLLQKNNCDYILANDISTISKDTHLAYLVNKNNNVITCKTKNEIAETIANLFKI